jgi:hypothetical protein
MSIVLYVLTSSVAILAQALCFFQHVAVALFTYFEAIASALLRLSALTVVLSDRHVLHVRHGQHG